MTRARKTIKVSELLARFNRMERYAAMNGRPMTSLRVFMDSVLMDSGNYEGYAELAGGGRQYRTNERTATS